MRIYVIGPVTGREGRNRAAFEEARRALREAGYDVTIPHEIVSPRASWERAMRHSLSFMLRQRGGRAVRGVAMLDGWEDSSGARLEHEVAGAVGIDCRPWREWL